jgi:hypothetical protein
MFGNSNKIWFANYYWSNELELDCITNLPLLYNFIVTEVVSFALRRNYCRKASGLHKYNRVSYCKVKYILLYHFLYGNAWISEIFWSAGVNGFCFRQPLYLLIDILCMWIFLYYVYMYMFLIMSWQPRDMRLCFCNQANGLLISEA